MKHHLRSIAIGAALLTGAGLGCGGGSQDSGPLSNVDALVILQRPKRTDSGDIFQYTSYIAGAKIVKLSPPTADGKLTTLCCDKAGAEFANIDINSYDLSFDATQIVFAGKLAPDQHYGLFMLNLTTNAVVQLATDPGHDYVNPIFLPGDKIMFNTNAVVEAGAPQHEDEYERGTTTQVGIMNTDGTGEEEGARNLSHRTAPSLASDGRVIFTQWDHLGPMNQGDLMFMNPDMQDLREAFGKEGTAASNSNLKATEISPGRFITIGTARNRTINAGSLIDARLGLVSTDGNGNVRADNQMSEANSTYQLLTPDVPLDNTPSANTIGRYYDAYPLDQKDKPALLVSWADGPVETSSLSAAGLSPNFGIYLYDSATQQRFPILDDPAMWDVFAKPLMPRTAPPQITSATNSNGYDTTSVLVGAMNTYTSTLHNFAPGSIYGVRVMEGFSSEEGFPEKFGTTMFEGHANLGVARLAGDGSFLATIPANIPVHMQAVDQFGMSLFNEPVWNSGRAGESRVCGGCHESRSATTVINPGITQAAAIGPTSMYESTPRAQRQYLSPVAGTAPAIDKVMGVAWDTVVQPVFDAKCVSCHDGTPGPANPSYQISNPTTGDSVTWTFNLKGNPAGSPLGSISVGTTMLQTFSPSYFSMAGPDMEAIEKADLVVTGNFKVYMQPTNAAGSILMQKLNPVKLFPAPDTTVRAFDTTMFPPHATAKGFTDLSPDEYYVLILAADMGVNYYARENNPHNAGE